MSSYTQQKFCFFGQTSDWAAPLEPPLLLRSLVHCYCLLQA